MAERVFNKIQLGEQTTFAAPGASVAATVLFPGAVASWPELDRATAYPTEDHGRNARNAPGRGSHGARGVSFSLSGEVRFNDFMYPLEAHWAGDIAPTGTGPYTYVYDLETGSPTIQPMTAEMGSETSQDQWEVVGFLINDLTAGFEDLSAPGYAPWTFEASCVGIDRASAALTAALSPLASGMETLKGHYSIIKEGATSTAFGSLSELSASLIGFQVSSQRALVIRIYGGTNDYGSGWGFSEMSTGTVTAKVKVGATAKTDFLDVYNVAGGVASERRWRVEADGNGNHVSDVDLRVGITGVQPDERAGEGVYGVTGELVYDATLDALATWTLVNDVAALV